MSIPALLYYCQNYTVYAALMFISAPVFQVTYQSKLVTMAMLSVCLLDRQYSVQQWLCILVLSIGVAIVAVAGNEADTQQTEGSLWFSYSPEAVLGLSLVGIACLCSSLAGVYFEKVLKNLATKEPVSMWMRNIQLSIFSMIMALLQGLGSKSNKPFFHGFTTWVWVQMFLLGVGGLLVAAVMKYTSTVTKGLATGISVVVSSVASNLIWGAPSPTFSFALGASLIVGGAYVFSNPLQVSQKQSYGIFMLVLTCIVTWFNLQIARDATSSLPGFSFQSTVSQPLSSQYPHIVDVLAFGSHLRRDYQEAQRQTWASHASVRHYFGINEDFDIDRNCFTDLSSEDIYSIANFCRKPGKSDSPLQKVLRQFYANEGFLKMKGQVVAGWMCTMPRPTLGMSALKAYYKENREELPDYLLMVGKFRALCFRVSSLL